MPHKTRVRPEKVIEVFRHHFGDKVGLIVLLVAIVAFNAWNPEPSAEDVNKRRAEINKQLTVELNECIAGNSDVIVGLHNCRPFKNHKDARIWRVK